jgi:hypothetical protein
MTTDSKQRAALFVERSYQQWIVRDPDGNFWLLPSVENPWSHRQPFCPTPDMDLEPVPRHYHYLLDLPF